MKDQLIPGLKFAEQHDLTRKEITVFLHFLQGPQTVTSIASELGDKKNTTHQTINRLRLRNLIRMKSMTENKEYVFEINPSFVDGAE